MSASLSTPGRRVDPTWMVGSDAAAVVLLVLSGHAGGVLGPVLVCVFAVNALLLAGFVGADRTSRRVRRVEWNHLDVPAVHTSRALLPARFTEPERTALAVRVPLYAGVLARLGGAGRVWVLAASALAVLAAAAVVGVHVADWWRARGNTAAAQVTAHLADAVAAYAPRIVFYVSRPDDPAAAGYLGRPWLPALAGLSARVLVITREREHVDALAAGPLPVVFIERASDLERILPASVGLALYPGHAARNNHLIRLPGVRDVFIGYGDSDKPASASPLARAFDEVWVSGPAARARYVAAGLGIGGSSVADIPVREIGLPRTYGPRPSAPTRSPGNHRQRLTVLYAPTQEGLHDEPAHCSLARFGRPILETLLARADVDVVFRPHPSLGRIDPDLAEHARRLALIVTGAGPPHRVSNEPNADVDLDAADVLISDVSALVTDFVARGRPVVLTDPIGWVSGARGPARTLVDAAYVLESPERELPGYLDLIRSGDPGASARVRAGADLVGPTDAFARFGRAVDDALAERPSD